MRLDINLASRPYQDAREFWLRWGTALVVVSILSLGLILSTIGGWYNARRDRATIEEIRERIAQRDQLHAQAEDFLNLPENRSTRDHAQIINALIDRKAFSWTRVLEDMEKVMPPGVHLVSIRPELDEEGQLAVKMVVAGSSRDRAIELARRMEDSHRFSQTSIVNERTDHAKDNTNMAGSSVEFDMGAIYVPQPFGESASQKDAPGEDAPAAPKKNAPLKPVAKGRKS
jgi:type IV pilus assembly protein PilN